MPSKHTFSNLLSVHLAALLAAAGLASANPTLQVSPPAGWNVEYKATSGLDFYTVTTHEAGAGLLMFHKWPPQGSPDEIPMRVQRLAVDEPGIAGIGGQVPGGR